MRQEQLLRWTHLAPFKVYFLVLLKRSNDASRPCGSQCPAFIGKIVLREILIEHEVVEGVVKLD